MKKVSLTADQKKALKSHYKNVAKNVSAFVLKPFSYYAQDWSIASIADALLLHETTVA